MPHVEIQCPKCHEVVQVSFRTPDYGHGATEEALAVHDAIKNHHCKLDLKRKALGDKL